MVHERAAVPRTAARPAVLVLALVSTAWAAVVLDASPEVRVLVPLVFAVGLLTMVRWPVLGATLVCAGQAVGLALGAPAESPAGLVAGLSAMVVLGRRSRAPGALLPVLGSWAVIVATDISPVRRVLGLALFGAAYGIGITLRRSAERTAAAEDQLRELEAVEVAARARDALETERRRLTEQSTRIVATATLEMRAIAREAVESLDPALLNGLRRRGEVAVDELRALLGVLRDPAGPEIPSTLPVLAGRSPWRVDVLTALVLGALEAIVRLVDAGGGPLPLWLGLTLGAVALRRTVPAVAVLVAAAGLAGQWATGETFVLDPAVAVAVALVVWSAVGAPSIPRLAALVPLGAAAALVTAPAGDGSLEVVLTILLGTALGSYVWHRLESKHAAADARSAAYSRRVDVAVASAALQERLAVARDLHDVASGAIGVMMLHTSVADVQRDTEPAAARSALERVVAAGDGALDQLALLERALAPEPHGDHATALEGLAARATALGLDVRLELEAEPRDGTTAAVAWRVVNEALNNALKHAHGARVDVLVDRDDVGLVVRVRDDGRSGTSDPPVGTGFGLRGLTELVERHGGSIRFGPAGDRPGFEVVARLPERTGTDHPGNRGTPSWE